MKQIKFEISYDPSSDDVRAIEEGLGLSVPDGVVSRNYKSLAVLMRDSDGEICGGLEGSTYWGWLNIRLLWVSDGLRGTGLGKRLVDIAEKHAVERGCRKAVVDTFSFQATKFYEKLGYEIFGALKDFPEGHERYYLKKDIIK